MSASPESSSNLESSCTECALKTSLSVILSYNDKHAHGTCSLCDLVWSCCDRVLQLVKELVYLWLEYLQYVVWAVCGLKKTRVMSFLCCVWFPVSCFLSPDRLRCVVRVDSLMLDCGSCSMMQRCNATGYMTRENVIFTLYRCRGCPGACWCPSVSSCSSSNAPVVRSVHVYDFWNFRF